MVVGNVDHKWDGVNAAHAGHIQLDQHQRGPTRIRQAALIEESIAQAVENEGATI